MPAACTIYNNVCRARPHKRPIQMRAGAELSREFKQDGIVRVKFFGCVKFASGRKVRLFTQQSVFSLASFCYVQESLEKKGKKKRKNNCIMTE